MAQQYTEPTQDMHAVIEMAWDDKMSFDAIERTTGLSEKEVITIMRGNMKPSSFRMWRKRVSGRKAKHERLLRPSDNGHYSNRPSET